MIIIIISLCILVKYSSFCFLSYLYANACQKGISMVKINLHDDMVIMQTVSTDRSLQQHGHINQCTTAAPFYRYTIYTYCHYHQPRAQHLKETSIIVRTHEMLIDQDILSIHHQRNVMINRAEARTNVASGFNP